MKIPGLGGFLGGRGLGGLFHGIETAALDSLLSGAVPAVVARLDSDHMTFIAHPDADGRRQVVRAAIYLLFKGTIVAQLQKVPFPLPKLPIPGLPGITRLANPIADFIRDKIDDKVVPQVLGHYPPGAGPASADLVPVVKTEIIRHVF